MTDTECQSLIDAMAAAMEKAVGEELQDQALFEIMAWGMILPETQAEIQRRMAEAVGAL